MGKVIDLAQARKALHAVGGLRHGVEIEFDPAVDRCLHPYTRIIDVPEQLLDDYSRMIQTEYAWTHRIEKCRRCGWWRLHVENELHQSGVSSEWLEATAPLPVYYGGTGKWYASADELPGHLMDKGLLERLSARFKRWLAR